MGRRTAEVMEDLGCVVLLLAMLLAPALVAAVITVRVT